MSSSRGIDTLFFLLRRNPFSKTSSPDLGGGNSIFFEFSPRKLGEDFQFDFCTFFQMGWFNHQLVIHSDTLKAIQILSLVWDSSFSYFWVCSRSCSKSGKGLRFCLNSCSGNPEIEECFKRMFFFFRSKIISLSIPKGGWVFSFRISEASYMLHLKTSGAAAECWGGILVT